MGLIKVTIGYLLGYETELAKLNEDRIRLRQALADLGEGVVEINAQHDAFREAVLKKDGDRLKELEETEAKRAALFRALGDALTFLAGLRPDLPSRVRDQLDTKAAVWKQLLL